MALSAAVAAGGGTERIAALQREPEARFAPLLRVDEGLTRGLVSFQDSRRAPGFRWFRFKEAFSPALVERLLDEYGYTGGRLLDPFAGSGAALFAAAARGMEAEGVELLPIGQQIIGARRIASGGGEWVAERLRHWLTETPWRYSEKRAPLCQLRITTGAYPAETQEAIERYIGALADEDEQSAAVLRFAALCVLETVSYTRKDGQYLRWDHRAGRSWGKHKFNKGRIVSFEEAIAAKLSEMLEDLSSMFDTPSPEGTVRVMRGSCLDILPAMARANAYDVVFTSPPYCNRYDYTRTYALELALLGVGEAEIVRLRQAMVSCTVENREKDLTGINPAWVRAVELAKEHPLLYSIDEYLEGERAAGRLNNSGIPRMVRGYFAEMACVIAEMARTLKPGGRVFMVNDNVRYAGVAVPVDLILSDIAGGLGLETEAIRVLPGAKGNSSQQMGRFTREPLRKCVYVWRKR